MKENYIKLAIGFIQKRLQSYSKLNLLLISIIIVAHGLNGQSPGGVSTGLKLWLRADTGTSVSVSGGAVTTWSDQSGNGNHAIQNTTINKPQYRRGTNDDLNFNPFLYFDGNDALSIPYSNGSGLNGNVTAFAVNNLDANATANWRRLFTNASPGKGYQWWIDPGIRTVSAGTQIYTLNHVAGRPEISTFDLHLGSSQAVNQYVNGKLEPNVWGSNLVNYVANSTAPFIIGSSGSNSYWLGQIGELILFDSVLTSSDRQRVNSYLALKYGIPLNQTIAMDYLATDGSVIWNANLNRNFSSNISGIGRDDAELLYQKQSKTISNGFQMSIGLDKIHLDNRNNPETFASDRSYLIWGDNNQGISIVTELFDNLPSGLGRAARMARIWKTQKTGSVDSILIAIPSSFFTTGIKLYFIQSTDSTFSSVCSWLLMSEANINGTMCKTVKVSLDNAVFFTFGSQLIAPGGIAAPALWLRPDHHQHLSFSDSAGFSNWRNSGTMNMNMVQSNAINQPRFRNKVSEMLNYIPVISFNAAAGTNLYGTYDTLMNRNITTFTVNSSKSALAIQMPIANRNYSTMSGWDIYYNSNGTRILQSANGTNWTGLLTPSSIANNWLVNQYEMIGFDLQVGVNQPANVYLNGSTIASGTISYKANNSSGWVPSVGRLNESTAYPWDGNIAEQIVYPSVLNARQRNQVFSYLAIKYGLTLNQVNMVNYYSSDSNVMIWNANRNSGFKNNVAGIGRDEVGGLYQRQSKSSNSGYQVEIFTGQLKAGNHLNTGSISNDVSYLIWGDNGGSLGFGIDVSNNKPGGLGNMSRMGKVWKIQLTSFVDSVTVAMQSLLFKGTDNYLLLSNDSTFNSGNIWISLSDFTANGIMYKGAKCKFTGNGFFTFASNAHGPGGVAGAKLWLKANDNSNVSYKDNLSMNVWQNNGSTGPLTQSNPNIQPVFRSNGNDNINFNPVVKFNGSNQYFVSTSILGAGTYNDASTFVVSSTDVVKSQSIFMESLSSGQQFNLHLPWNNSAFYWDGASSNRVTLAWGANVNMPYLWTGWNSNVKSPRNAFYRNGSMLNSNSSNINFTGNNSAFYIGCQNINNYFQGKIGEVLIFLKPITAIERQKIESYLAIKYGMTLDQTTPTDYLSVSGDKVWNANWNKSFNQNIAGIGRDDDQELLQKQSKSSNFSDYFTVALGQLKENNALNSMAFSSNGSYLIWGDNGGAIGYGVSVSNNMPSGIFNAMRMGRVWKIQKTGTVDTVEVALPEALIPGDVKYLVVSNDSSFNSGNIWYKLDSTGLNNRVYYSKRLVISNGQFITFVSRNPKPGGVNRIATWIRADDGINNSLSNNAAIGVWSNVGGSMDASQSATGQRPVYLNNGNDNINFNPVISFDGTDDHMNVPYSMKNNGEVTAFSIHVQNSSNTSRSPLSSRNTTGFKGWSYMINNTDRQLILGTGTNWNQITSSNITTGKYELLSFDAKPGNNQPTNLFADNVSSSNGLLNYSSNTTNNLTIGASSSNSNFWNGKIAEQMIFDTILSAQERLQVNTYLAVKYGVGINQNTPNNYIGTDGSTILWNANINRYYRFNLAGLGRDDIEALHQKQSSSANLGRQIVVGVKAIAANNKSNLNSVGDDRSYLIWGDNDGSMYFSQPITQNLPSGISNVYRMNRVWKVQKTGNVNEVQVAIPGTYSTTALKYLVVSSDSTFATGNTWYAINSLNINNAIHWGTNVNFSNGVFFTFVGRPELPGGVGGMSVWLKSNDYLLAPNSTIAGSNHNKSIAYWSNLGTGKDFIQDDIAKRPIFKFAANTNYVNFNPSIAFGSPSFMKVQGDLGLNGNKDVTVFAVNKNVSGIGFILQPDSAINHALDLSSNTAGQSGIGLFGSTVANGTSGVVGSTYISGGYRSGNSMVSMVNDASVGTASSSTDFAKAKGYVLNVNTAGTSFQGAGNSTTELIIYPYTLSQKQRAQVATYLAIKNGCSLNYTSGNNYLSSDSNLIVWNTSMNAAFNKNVTGIGRDDVAGLDQRFSQSNQSGTQILMGFSGYALNNLFHNTPFTADKQFLFCGDNDSSMNLNVKVQSGNRMSRVWKVQKTGNVGTIRFGLPVSVFSNNINNKYLIISTDSTFRGQYRRTALGNSSINGVNYYAANVQINDGEFFTFADLQCNYPVLTAINSRIAANAGSCTVDGWLFYKDPSNTSQSLVAIHPNGNVWNPDSVIVDFSTAGTYSKTDGINTTALSKRMLTIVAPGSYTVNGGVKVRMYYDTAEHNGLPTTSQNWYKHKGNKYKVLKDLNSKRLDSCQILLPNVSGSENGVSYVEFHNITSFSTFGFGGSTDLTALAIKLIEFKAEPMDRNCLLTWKLLSDKHELIKIQIQRSTDGVNWQDLHSMSPELSASVNEFSFVDVRPFNPICFYRLLMVTEMGEIIYSKEVLFECPDSDNEINIFPNPSNGMLTVVLGNQLKSGTIQVIDLCGQILYSETYFGKDELNLNLEELSEGIYTILVFDEFKQCYEKIILK